MKAFRKWLKKNKPYKVYSCMNMAEKAYRAALKEVLKRLDNICENDELRNWIKKELENG